MTPKASREPRCCCVSGEALHPGRYVDAEAGPTSSPPSHPSSPPGVRTLMISRLIHSVGPYNDPAVRWHPGSTWGKVMTISERVVAGVTILDIHGPLLEDEADNFCESVRPILLSGHANMVMNLHDVPYIDSMSLGEIVRAYTTAIRLGGTVKLLQVGPRVRELLTTTRLSGVLVSFDSEDDAVRSFGASST